MSDKLLIGPATVFTNTPDNPVVSNAGVVCDGDRIERIAPWHELATELVEAKWLPADGMVVLPGMINAHHHLYSTFARGMPLRSQDKLGNFPEILEGIWWRLDRALDIPAVSAGAFQPVFECLRWGTTTIIDHHSSPNAIYGSLGVLAAACCRSGLKSCHCYEITDRNGPDAVDDAIGENTVFAKNFGGQPGFAALIGLHASFTLTEETLARVASEIPQDIPIHIHVAEDRSDVVRTREQYGCGIIERLERHGLLRKNSVLAHGIYLTDEELDRIAAAEAWLVHNPDSNANNAVGHLDVEHALARGVRVALGTDGMSSNMLRTAKSAYLMMRDAKRDPTVGFGLPRKLLFENNVALAREIFGDPKMGSIQPGAPADLCVVAYHPATPLNDATFDSHLVFGITEAPVVATVTDGGTRMLHGKVLAMDEDERQEDALAVAGAVWSRLRETDGGTIKGNQ
ncbi:MAG: amidohydrolase family protein [Polyangiaceae bacterium]|nr:amidohydrolase family protein [Polyangiaceae bacterium]